MKKVTAISAFIIVLLAAFLWVMYSLPVSDDIDRGNDFGAYDYSDLTWNADYLSDAAYVPVMITPKPTIAPTIAPEREGIGELGDMIGGYISVRSGSWGVYVKNLGTNEYLILNDGEYSSASLIKLFTMAAVYNAIETGSVSADDDVNSDLARMICESDNAACNRLTRLLGGGDAVRGMSIENANTSAIGCRYTNHGSEIVDGSGHKVVFTGYNLTSPRDCGIVLEQIYRGRLVSPESSAKMLDLLLNQTRTWKIPSGLPDGTVAANKTGETDKTEGDAAIVYSPACNYVICVIGNGSVGSGVETIKHISTEVYNYFNHSELAEYDDSENNTEGI